MVERVRQRLYFFWDYDITEEEVREILRGDDEPRKVWVMSRILEYARFDDVWRYVTPSDLRQYFERLHLRPQVREVWARAIEVWNRQVFLLESRDEPALKVDLVRDVDVQFGTCREIEGIVVDAEENIAVNKVLSVFGRTESKDFVDLYFLLQAGHDFRHLVALARQKDTGLSEFWLAGMLREVTRLKDLPQMLKPLTLEELQSFFLELADREFAAVRPPDWD
jgi:hypothetical protein